MIDLITSPLRRFGAHVRKDSMFRNSMYIMLSTGVMSGAGFLFWMMGSRLFSPADIGVTTSLVSIASLLSILALFGLNNAIVRFLASSRDRNAFISSVFGMSSLGSILFSGVFLLWAHTTESPIVTSVSFGSLAFLFIVHVVLQTALIVMDSVFIADRKAHYIFGKNILLSIVKLVVPMFLTSYGVLGLMYGVTAGSVIAILLGSVWMYTMIGVRVVYPTSHALSHVRLFATGNYVGSMLAMLPASLLPVIVLSRVGASEAAYFYIPFAVVTLLNVIPNAAAQSLFAEVSRNEDMMYVHGRKAMWSALLILIVAIGVVFLGGDTALSLFGQLYVTEGGMPLRILALGSIAVGINYFGDTFLNVKKRTGTYVAMNAFCATSVVMLGYILAPYGLIYVAWAYVGGQTVTAIAYIVLHKDVFRRMRRTEQESRILN